LNNPPRAAILRRVTKLLKYNNLVRGALLDAARCAVTAGVLACGGSQNQAQEPKPQPTAPLPSGGLAGQRVGLFPLTLIAAEDSLRWNALLADRRGALGRADSVMAELIAARAPEATWVLPEELRRAARRSPGVIADPDHIGTAILRADGLVDVPDPLRSQLRTLVAMAGGRYALVPAALVYRRTGTDRDGRGRTGTDGEGQGRTAAAELSVVLVDVRLGKVGFRTIARGEGDDPWSALSAAVKALTPGLP
jgi:hypothetical protein